MLELREKDLDAFFEVPLNAYGPDFPFVSEIKADLERFLSLKNPLFRGPQDYSFFTVHKDGKAVGRIVTHIHARSNEVHKLKRSYFGYFDCINDEEVARLLLKQAEDFGRRHGCNELAGNFNLTAMQKVGVVTKIHRHYHYTDQIFAPEYVAALLKKCGYEAFFPMWTFDALIKDIPIEAMKGPKQKEVLENPKFKFEKLKFGNTKSLMEAMRICLNDGFSDNPMFVPLTQEEVEFQAKDLMLIVDRQTSIVCYEGGKPIGVIICIPNLNPMLKEMGSRYGWTTPWYFIKHKFIRDSALMIFYSVKKEYHSQGVNGAMLYEVLKALKRRGYKSLGGTWVAEENKPSMRQVEKMAGHPMHELHLYRKSL
ncbi:MAG: GNAT family N-acetyltransferase [Bdellovibrionota bacterium]